MSDTSKSMTVQRLYAMVEARMRQVDKNEWSHGEPDVPDTARWFIAVYEAKFMLDSYKLRDMAEIIRDGLTLGGPYLTDDDVAQWIANMEEGGDEHTWDWLDAELDRHFGVYKKEK